MAHEIEINIGNPVEEITILAHPQIYSFSTNASNLNFALLEPNNSYNLSSPGDNGYNINSGYPNDISTINAMPQLCVNLGDIPLNPFITELNGYKYTFPNFVDGGTSSFVFGDVVYLESDLTAGANDWNAKCKKADVTDIAKGAYSSLFIFISHEGNTLHILNKGYFDLENGNITQWTAGRTIYLNATNKFDITPTGDSGNWVRSLGFAIPNTQNKKRIWFEADSTYLKII
tara:strand:+ start:161 stop:853 length:693 start_codon:yes stop_codon:yes gene_type:complete